MSTPNVKLINYTQNARELLIFTKSTRLEMSPSLFDDIMNWSEEKKLSELEYMSNTIPSSWEFVDYVFLVTNVSRSYTHQQVRTRTASFAQQTMRVTNMNEFDYIYTDKNLENKDAVKVIDDVLDCIKDGYRKLQDLGQPNEDARGILPTNISTNIVCKFNLRTLSELAKSRTGGRTQNEYRKVVNAMIDEVLLVHPWAEKFLFRNNRDFFKEIEDYAARKFSDITERGELLKIVDHMRKEIM